MLTNLQYRILKRFWPTRPDLSRDIWFTGPSRVGHLFGEDFLCRIQGKIVADFGCGEGREAIELARLGATKVYGVEILSERLGIARELARQAKVAQICEFVMRPPENADIVLSIDAFEHFDDPGSILREMDSMLAPQGEVWISFGPPWYHPIGGHLFSVFPWAHLVFSEKALIRWRSDFKHDGATRFSEVAGGLNQMTIARFERIVEASPLRITTLTALPIRKLKPLHSRLTREFTTAAVRCVLVKK
ncbi:MAG TPA: class I SAM-dependent methyltransferase [Bryobacteraceae bacterium]|nr:class I SAM-dependent methyltransferase [Bryobacteraceae bacterium]